MTAHMMSLAGSPFDTITGIPLHPLVVHAASVLLPLSVLGLIVAVLIPRTRPRLAGLSVLGLAAGAVAAWIAEESGEALAATTGAPQNHARYGELVPILAVLSVIAAVAWWRIQRGPRVPGLPGWAPRAAAAGACLLAVATTWVTVLAGHSGAVAVWASEATAATAATADPPAASATAAAAPASGSPVPEGSPAAAGSTPASSGYTLAEVAGHNTQADCWSVVDGKVYRLTAWIAQHPGGAATIVGMCGRDSSSAFHGKHATAAGPATALAGYAIGDLAAAGSSVTAPAGATPAGAPSAVASSAVAPSAALPVPTTRYTRAEVSPHASATSCWSIVNGIVYDLTPWITRHPGGAEGILDMCGTNGAGEFFEQHAGDADAATVLAGYRIGVLG
jgi:cytochrome b involved in lipid metabolism/uncharacterized membrane protein